MAVTEEARELLGSAGLQHDRAQLAIVAALTGSDPGPVAVMPTRC